MTYLNTYTRPIGDIPKDIHLHTPEAEYDFNYVFDVVPLKSDRVQLRPLVPSLHAQLFFDGCKKYPEILRWLGLKPFEDISELLVWIETTCRRPSDSLFYAIFTEDTANSDNKEYQFAGIMGMITSDYQAMKCEPGYIMILSPFHRTHVQTHATGLIMHRILDHPSQGGLGLRRCQWTTTTLNLASQKASQRLGYSYEGILRCMKVLPEGKEGARDGRGDVRQAENQVRDDWYASVTWYDWEERVRQHIDNLMARRS